MNDGDKVRVSFRSPWVDSIPSEWGQVKLGHISKIYSGGTPDKKNDEYWTNGTIPWLNSGTVNQGLITEISEFISEQAFANSSARWVPKGSLVMALAGQGKTKGMVAQLGIDATCNQSMAAIVLEEDHPRYMLYWLSSNYRNIRGIASDDTRDGLNLTHLKNIPCPRPSINEQIAIAGYLDAETKRIDGLIEEKNKLSEHLSELRKRAIYEAVFVDRVGWKRSRLKFVSDSIIDTEHKTCPYYDDGKYMVVRTTNIKSGRLVFDDAKYTNEEGFRDWTQRAVPQPDDILLTREAPAGEACLVPFDVPLCVGQRTVLIKVDRRIAHPEFVLWSLYGGLSAQFIADLSRGSTVPHFNMGDIGDIPLCIGPLSEQIARTELLKKQLTQIDDLAGHVIKEVEKLRELRQATITDAVLGRIDVREFAPH